MSSLTDIDKRYLEKLLEMQGGYVLDYSDATYGEFFNRHNVDIHSTRYRTYGTSKAKKMRAFWEQEDDALVSIVLTEMLDGYAADCDLNDRELDASLLEKCRTIVSRLGGEPIGRAPVKTANAFLQLEFDIPSVAKLPIDTLVVPIIESRLAEAQTALGAKAYLSVIFLCGSVLEAVLLGAAQKEPAKFNKAASSAKNPDGTVKKFHEWSLSQFIDTASELGILKPDIKTFSHGLRDYRNYIHPYQQMASGFTPDDHTARICFQVLKAALASVAGER